MLIFGIDPGISGAICALKEGNITEIYEMPTMIDGKKNKRQVNGAEVANIFLKEINNQDSNEKGDTAKVVVIISADHSTPCIMKGHSDDPVPLLISGDVITNDDTQRYTEIEAKKGAMGLIEGAQVVKTGINIIKS